MKINQIREVISLDLIKSLTKIIWF